MTEKKRTKKNPAAVALGKRRAAKIGKKRVRQIAASGGRAFVESVPKHVQRAIRSAGGKAAAKKRAQEKAKKAEE